MVEFHEFPDHHVYSPADLDALAAAARQAEAEALVCTQKDLVKIGADRLGDRPLWAIRVGIDFLAGREALERELLTALSGYDGGYTGTVFGSPVGGGE